MLRKAKKAYYENLDKSNVSDNKPFWKTVNPIRKIQCERKDKFQWKWRNCENWNGRAGFLKKCFANIVKNLNISQHSDFDPVIENVKDPTLRGILEYKNTLAFWRSEINVIGIMLLVLGRSVGSKLKQK